MSIQGRRAFIPVVLSGVLLPLSLAAQAPATGSDTTSQTSASPATTLPQKPSSLIAPAIDGLSRTISQVRLERWKSPVRDETDSNLQSIEKDIANTLPGLVTTADAQPASVAASLPLLRNLNALCAVVVRVSVTANGNAPADQANALARALTTVQSARDSLNSQLQDIASTQEKEIVALQQKVTALSAQINSTPPPTPPQPPPPVKTHKKKTAKPASAK